mmetsp:Transcript_29206/g.62102  ORF Transcript_29206/g.62102 Transcript_29206/m.62102 type:complete len:511 (+) Transcript_29206:50-1582(+)
MAIVQVDNWRPSVQKKKQAIIKPACVGSMMLLAMFNMYMLYVHFTSISRPATFLQDAENSPKINPSKEGPLSVVNHPHGIFFFWQDSHQVRIPKHNTIEQSLTDAQKDLLNDEDIDMNRERRRCASYKFGISNQTPTKRRRLFLGGLVADDSMEVMTAVGLEAYNIFHTVSFVESNSTQNLSPRKWRYMNSPSERHKLYQLFGPQTKVSVDYYVTSRRKDDGDLQHNDALIFHEKLQKEGIIERWRKNGMRPDDVAIIVDADEMFTRDFLRALQVCDVPQLRSTQSCFKPKIIASALVFESSPECITKGRRSHHPDAILGACIDLIGNSTLHPPTMRKWSPDRNERNITKRIKSSHGSRLRGYGGARDYSLYESVYKAGQYPLWSAGDFRDAEGGEMITKQDGSGTAYHFHNFFTNASQIHWKYYTYGHAIHNAMDKPIWELHEDLELGVKCAKGENGRKPVDSFDTAPGNVRPIYYLNEEVRKTKHLAWQNIVREEENAFARLNNLVGL